MEVLYLNKYKVDLPKNPITRKIQIADIGDIEKWKSSYSYTVKLPKTANNIQILDMLAAMGNTSRKPHELISCDYIVDGFSIVNNGYAIIRESSDGYNINIVDGVKSLAEILGEKKLKDLDLTSLEHNFTLANFTNSFANTSGYIYALANFGQINNIDINAFLSANSGVAITGNHSVPFVLNSKSEGSGAKSVVDYADLTTVNGAFYQVENITSKLTIDIDISASYIVNTDSTTIELRLKQFRSAVIYDNRLLASGSGNTGATISFSFSASELYTDIDLDDYFILTITGNNTDFEVAGFFYYMNTNGLKSFKIEKNLPSIFLHTLISEIATQNNISFEGAFFTENTKYLKEVVTLSLGFTIDTAGQVIKPGEYLGEINQVALLKDLTNRYGLILIPGDSEKKYTFLSIDSILNDKANAEDWSDKFAEFVKENYHSGYARNNYARFNYNENVTENYNGNLIVDNANSEMNKDLFTSIFEIPAKYGNLTTFEIYSIPVWSVENDIVSNEETQIKIMSIDKQDIDIDFQLLNSLTITNVTTDIPLLSLIDISLQDSFDNYYAKFNNVLDNYKLVEFMLNLSVIDIYNLDFSRLKYFKQTGQYYYLNSVQHTPDKRAIANLLNV